ncbi:MAG: N-acetylneuraminate synthase family protein [Rhodospirillales bacterium]|nr:N-acetylneuraminate synthase family protein [Rhodospirillales bacterium]
MSTTQYIAEIGLNHLGSAALAEELIAGLIQTEADGITFQIREDKFYDRSDPWTVPIAVDDHGAFRDAIHAGHKKFGLSVGDVTTAKRAGSLAPDFWKVLSFGLSDYDLLDYVSGLGVPVFVSTGNSDYAEIEDAAKRFPRVNFIHTQLSPVAGDVNLKAIQEMRERTGRDVSFGLHLPDLRVLFMALCFGPEAVFFYVKGDDASKTYPDDAHAAALAVAGPLIRDLRQLETAIGTGEKDRA